MYIRMYVCMRAGCGALGSTAANTEYQDILKSHLTSRIVHVSGM